MPKSKRNSGTNATTIGDKYKETTITALNDIKIDDALLNVGLSQVKSENTNLSVGVPPKPSYCVLFLLFK
jgi:hypothetical protein